MPKEIVWLCNSDVKKRTIVGETLLLAVRSNRLLMLNKQATAIWNQLGNSEGRRESDMLGALKCEYPNVPVSRLETDIHNFLLDLQARGFVNQCGDHWLNQAPISGTKNEAAGHFSFSERLYKLATEQNIPIAGGLEITQHCHLKCIHCYIADQPIDYKKELSTDEICNTLTEMADCGCLWLLITGGEPLVRKDFSDIYQHAKELGMIVTVFTSATDITERIVRLFIAYPPFLVEATLHGATEITFDAIAGVRGAFRKFQRGIRLLEEGKIPFHLKMIAMRQNVQEVEDARQLALNMGAGDFRFDPMINADLSHSPKVADLRVAIKDAIKLDHLEPYRKRWERVYHNAINRQATAPQSSNGLLFPCRAGKCSFSISSDGQLLPCILARTPAFNLRRIPFSEAWKALSDYTNNARMERENLCLKCSVKACPKCPAWGYLEHGDLNLKSRFACALQEEREKAFLHLQIKGG